MPGGGAGGTYNAKAGCTGASGGGGGGGPYAGGHVYKWNKGGNGGCGLAIIRYQVKPKGLLLLFR